MVLFVLFAKFDAVLCNGRFEIPSTEIGTFNGSLDQPARLVFVEVPWRARLSFDCSSTTKKATRFVDPVEFVKKIQGALKRAVFVLLITR